MIDSTPIFFFVELFIFKHVLLLVCGSAQSHFTATLMILDKDFFYLLLALGVARRVHCFKG